MSTASLTDVQLGLIQKLRKVAVAVFLLLLIGLAVISQSVDGANGLRHEEIEAVGLAAIVVAIVGRAWCSLYIGGRKKAEVVSTGPYSMTRNPLYVFSFLAAFGMGAQTGSLVVAGLFVLAALIVFWMTVKKEEAYLSQTFGREYDDYVARTPRFWPNFSLWRDEPELVVRPSFFLLTIRDGLAFLLAVPLFELIERLQVLHDLKVFFHLP